MRGGCDAAHRPDRDRIPRQESAMRILLPALLLALAVLPANAAAEADPPKAGTAPEAQSIDQSKLRCHLHPHLCKPYANLVSFPAHALSWSTSGGFALQTRGVDWTGTSGVMSFTMHRPNAYVAGNRVRLRLVYEIPGDGDGDSIGFSVTPTSFHHGSGFETYGGEATGLIPAGSGTIHEQSVTFTFPGAYTLSGDWWYFEIARAGEFAGKLRLMSVAVEY
jgi:hypothetical protein